MKRMLSILTASVFLLGVGAVSAGEKEKTFEGEFSCLKCNLKKADSCADALQVKDVVYNLEEDGKVKTSAHKCQGSFAAIVTGKVEKRGDQKFIVVSKIEKK